MAKIIGLISPKEEKSNSAESTRIQEAKSIVQETSKMSLPERITMGQPGRLKAEESIAARPSAMKILKEEIAFKPDLKGDMGKKILKSGVTAIKGLGVVDERIQGAIAAPMIEMMNPFRKDIMQDTALAVINGVTGERPARFEDVIRAKLPEIKVGGYDISSPVSMIGGLAAEIYTGAGLVKMVRTMRQGGPQTINSIQKSLDLANEVKDVAGKEISTLFNNSVGKIQVPTHIVENIANSLPEGVFERIISKPKVYGVMVDEIKDAAGKIIARIPKSDAKNVWQLRKALDDLTTSKDFAGKMTSIGKDKVMLASNQLRQVLSNVDTKVAPIMEKYSNYAQTLQDASDFLTDGKGRVVVNKAANILKGSGEAGYRILLEKYAQVFPKGADMLRDIKILNRNRAVTAATMLAVKTAVGASIASKFIKPVTNVFTSETEAAT